MEFSEALKECMNGKKIRNMNWNGKSAYVYYTKGKKIDVSAWVGQDELTPKEKERGYIEILGHLDMMTTTGKRLIGWLVSQADVQSDAWEIVE